MTTDISQAASRAHLAAFYRSALLDDCIPFWLSKAMDREEGGIFTCLDREGGVVDFDKSVWFQGRAAWMFATLYNSVEKRPEWLEAARSCIEFSRAHCFAPEGKMYFSVTRSGQPLRMRRYVFSESFASIASAAYFTATGEERAREDALALFATYLRYSFEPGVMAPKTEATRPMQGIGAHMIGIVTAQELRLHLGDMTVSGRTLTEWIDWSIAAIERDFWKPELDVLMETVGVKGEIVDGFEGRMLNPGHAIECAWFVMYEGKTRGDKRLIELGAHILDAMWRRGWDEEFGGIFYFRDLRGLPIQEYWHDMKFWWPHNEALIATILAYELTGEAKYARWHALVHDWSFKHFADAEYSEWFGYLHRDGSVSSELKGSMWKGPFHLPRALWMGAALLG
ncbi:cellobiose 2-epimerase [Abditibacteriota bacterium]|nr:cellobiose 2-epimerase [Abditibacteriota bacterium]